MDRAGAGSVGVRLVGRLIVSAARVDRPGRSVLPALGVIGAVGVWTVVAAADLLPDRSFPSPGATAGALRELAADGRFWAQIGQTGSSWIVGLLVAVALAVPLGLLLGLSDLAFRMSRVVVEALRPIPPVVVLPLALLVLGGGTAFKVTLIGQGAVWPLLVQTSYGVRTTDPVALDTALSYRLGGVRRLVFVRLPSALPLMMTGLRLAAATAFAVCLVTELVGGAKGLGAVMVLAQSGGDVETVFAVTIVAGAWGLLIALVFGILERRALRWTPRGA